MRRPRRPSRPRRLPPLPLLPRLPALLTDRGRALLGAGATLTLSGILLGFLDLTRVGLLILGLPLIALALTRLTRPLLEVDRAWSPAAPGVGERVRAELKLRNRSRIPFGSSVAEERLSDGLGGDVRLLLEHLAGGERSSARYQVRPRRRGRHVVGPLRVRRGDPFGLTAAWSIVSDRREIVVLPRVHPLTGGASGGGGAENAGGGVRFAGASGVDDASLRGYRTGDDLRRVHWPVTAHRGELMVRDEGRPELRRAVLVIDPDLAAGIRDGASREAALDWAVEALASVAAHLAATEHLLHVVTSHDHTAAHALGDPVDLPEALRLLALVEPSEGGEADPRDTDEPRLVSAARELAAGGGLLVVAAGGSRPETARALFGARPSSVTGLAFVLEGGGSPGPHADDLAAVAGAGGWRATVVGPDRSIDAAWHDLVGADQRVRA